MHPDDSTTDNPWLQLAQSVKYSGALICTIAEISPGIFALYQHARVLYVGEWEGLLEHYRNRPAWVSPPHSPPPSRTSASQRAANTAALLARLAGEPNAT